MGVNETVTAMVKKYKSRNPFNIISGINAFVVYAPLNGVRGFYQYFQRNNIIYIDENLSEQEKMFVCAHELGHMILHRKANRIFMDSRTDFNTDKFEIEANKFAVLLLISDDDLMECRDFTTDQTARLLGYSERIIKLRYECMKGELL